MKTYKLSEQQINPKVLSVSNSCDYNGNSKNGKIVYGQMPAPTPTNSRPRAKIRMQKPRSGGKFSVQIPGGAREMFMAKIDSCIMHQSIPSANIPLATPGVLHLLPARVPRSVSSKLPPGDPTPLVTSQFPSES